MNASSRASDAAILSISLPSASKPARVSLSGRGEEDDSKLQRQFGSGHHDGLPRRLSVTEQFYGTSGDPPSTSSSSSAHLLHRTGQPLLDAKNYKATTIGSSSDPPPSILPPSGFLNPRRPLPAFHKQQNSHLLPLAEHHPRKRAGLDVAKNDGRSSLQTRGYSLHQQQQEDNAARASYDDVTNQSSSATASRSSIGARHGTRDDEQQDLHHHHQSSATALPDAAPAGLWNGGTLQQEASGILNKDARRYDTLNSKASQEPLLLSSGAFGQHQTAPRDPTPRSTPTKRKVRSTKPGGIGNLFGFGASSPASRLNGNSENFFPNSEKAAPSHASGRSPSQAEKGGADLANARYGNGHLTELPLSTNTTSRRNYQVYNVQRKAMRRSQNPKTPAEDRIDLGYGSPHYGGNNRFFLSGRLTTSGDNPIPFLASFAVAILLSAIYLAFESQWLWSSSSSMGAGFGNSGGKAIVIIFAYAALVMWLSMLRTALRDPGIVVKGLDREPDWETYAVPVGSADDLTGTGMGQRPRLRYIRIRDEIVSSKWCETCQTYRPPRTSHCRLCDVCTEQTDHHCSFLNNCIGRRNYNSFVAFLISAVVCALLAVGSSVAHLAVRAREAETSSTFWNDWRVIGSIVVVVLTGAAVLPVIGLLSYHFRLVFMGRTTIEMLRPKYPSAATGKPMNPYSYRRKLDNIVFGLCKPMDLYSAIDPHGYVRKDEREENPAFLRPRTSMTQ